MEALSGDRADRAETPSGLGAAESGERKQLSDEGTPNEVIGAAETGSGLREEEGVRHRPDLGEVSVEADFEQDEFSEGAAAERDAAIEEAVAGAGEGASPNRPESLPRRFGRQRQRVLRSATERAAKPEGLTAEQRLLLLDTWLRSGLPAGDFAALVGLSKHTLYDWKRKFDREGPGGLMDRPRGSGRRGSQLPELTKRTILMLKQSNPEWGCRRVRRRWRGCCTRRATRSRRRRRGRTRTRSGTSSGPSLINSGRPTCSRLSSSDRIDGFIWSRTWTITAASWSATGCTPANRRRWCRRCSG